MKKRILSAILAAVMLLGMIIMPATAAEGKMPFTDVKSGKWYYEAVEYVWKNDLMNGMTDTTFEPNTAMNRGMLVTVLWRVEGSPEPAGTTPFTDLKQNYYKKAVAWAYENDIVNGITTTTFAPEDPITREQIATIFFRYAKYAGRDVSAKGDLSKFPDESKVAKFAKEAMTWAVGEGLISGTKIDGKDYLDPKGKATRAQVATILMRYLESGKEETLEDKVEAVLDDYYCGAHTKLDLIFGDSDSLDDLDAVLTRAIGFASAVGEGEIDRIKEDYSGLGGGQFAWVDGVKVTFTEGDETYETEIDLSLHKNLYAKYSGALETGALGCCLEDWPDDVKDAVDKVGDWDDETEIMIPGEEFTPEAIEAWYRDVTGLTGDEWVFYINWFDAGKAYTGNETAIGLRNDDVNGEGRTFIVACGPTLSIEKTEPTLGEIIDERVTDLLCTAHDDVNFQFGGGSTLTEENLNAALTEAFGYPAAVDSEKFAQLKNDFSGADNGDHSVTELAPVTFTDETTGETYTAEFDIVCRKDLYGKYSGAVEAGVLTWCPDDRPEEITEALDAIAPYNGQTVELEDATIEGLEAFLREKVGLDDAEKYEFFYTYDEDGDRYNVAFKYVDAEDFGRTYTVGGGIKIAAPIVEPEQPMIVTWVDEAPDFTAPITAEAWGEIAQYIAFGYENNVLHDYNATCENVTGEMYYAYDNDYVYIGMVSPDADVAGSDGWWAGDGLQMKIYKDDANAEDAVNFAVTYAGDGTTVEYGSTADKGVYGNIVYADGNLNVMARIPVAALGLTADDIAEGTELGITFIRISGTSQDGYAGWLAYGAFFGPDHDYNPGLTEIGVITFGEKGSAVDPMYDAFDEFLVDHLCDTHDWLTMMHTGGAYYTAENVSAVILDAMGLDADTYAVVIEGELNDGGAGGGTFVGSDVDIHVENKVTGESTGTESVRISSRKLTAFETKGMFLYTCPEDSEVWKPSEEILNEYLCAHEDEDGDAWNIIHVLFPDEESFTEENFAAAIAAALEEVDGAEIYVTKFDPARLNTDSACRFYVYKWNGNVLEATDQYECLCSTADVDAPVLTAEHPVAGPTLEDIIEERLVDLLCDAHGKLDLQFGDKGTITLDNFNALLTEIFGADASMDPDGVAYIYDNWGGANGNSVWADGIEVTFTKGDETYTTEIDFSVRKDLYAKYTGAVAAGALSECPEEQPEEYLEAVAALAPYDDGKIQLSADQANAAYIEEYFRGISGLGDDWAFVYNWFDPESPEEIVLAFVNTDINGEGITLCAGVYVEIEIVEP